jgi:hypothetical protein
VVTVTMTSEDKLKILGTGYARNTRTHIWMTPLSPIVGDIFTVQFRKAILYLQFSDSQVIEMRVCHILCRGRPMKNFLKLKKLFSLLYKKIFSHLRRSWKHIILQEFCSD